MHTTNNQSYKPKRIKDIQTKNYKKLKIQQIDNPKILKNKYLLIYYLTKDITFVHQTFFFL